MKATVPDLTHVPEDHCLHVDRGTHQTGDLVDPAIGNRLGGVPGSEHGLDGRLQLAIGILRERLADMLLVDGLVAIAELAETLGRHIRVLGHLVLLLDGIELRLEVMMIDAHHDVAEHVDEPTVRIEREAVVAGQCRHSVHRLIRETEIEDRVHHSRHGHGRATSNRHEQWIRLRSELLAGLAFKARNRGLDAGHQTRGKLAATGVECLAGLGRDGESGRYRQPD